MKRKTFGLFLAVTAASAIAAETAPRERGYALLLSEPPLVEQTRSVSLKGNVAAASIDIRLRVADSQQRAMAALPVGKYRVTSTSSILVNAVFVHGPEGAEKELAALPGVQRVVKLRSYKRLLYKAINLVNAPNAWTLAGGDQNAGLGVKIGIIDSGIDPNHPGMNDPSLPPPPGGKKCAGSDCDYTNNKIIAARNYTDLADLSLWADDYTPRDHVGHGTAVAMIAAGVRNTGPAGTIEGVAPRAYLGNYKVFGSPGVNDTTNAEALTNALNDAYNDGMDIVTLSLGYPADWTPTDVVCGQNQNLPCDPVGYAVANAMRNDMTVVVAAGNDGEYALHPPAFTTINTPGTVTDAITVGSTTNSHALYYGVAVTGNDAPSNLRRINATLGDGGRTITPVTAPLRDVSKLGNDGLACTPLAGGSLTGAIAVVSRGTCDFSVKVINAAAAGAVGVIAISGDNFLFPPTGLGMTGIPMMLIGKDDGAALLGFLAGHADRAATMDLTLAEASPAPDPDIVSTFSSLGPSIVQASIKPELVAPGENIYTATQKYDPNSYMYDPSGYTTIGGTSFSVPFVAGAVALVKQKNPSWTAAQLKSAVVNTANPDVGDTDNPSQVARVLAMGAGKLDAAQALSANLTVSPSVVSFGIVTTLPLSQGLTFYNGSNATLSVALSGQRRDPDNNTQINISPASFTLQPGAVSQQVTVQLTGSTPAPGIYEGVINVSGGAVPLRIPFLYQVGDGVPNNLLPLSNFSFSTIASYQGFGPLDFKVIDQYAVPVSNAPVKWTVTQGGGAVTQSSGSSTGDPNQAQTDSFGINEAYVTMGSALGLQIFSATLPGTSLSSLDFYGTARSPNISAIISAANGQSGGQAPGSYVSIYGSGLADTTSVFRTPYLPLSLAGITVGFEVPNRFQVPGRIHFVSPGQINVEVPWELQGQSSANVWLTVGGVAQVQAPYQLPLQSATPAVFPGAVLDGNYKVVNSANPAVRGQYIQIFANALGPLDHTPATGEPAPAAEPLARLQNASTLSVTIGGVASPSIYFAGLAPGIVGLYQVNAQVPTNVGTGNQAMVLTVSGVASQQYTLPVQ